MDLNPSGVPDKFAAIGLTYDQIHRHILQMADVLSAGILAQFPRRFRS